MILGDEPLISEVVLSQFPYYAFFLDMPCYYFGVCVKHASLHTDSSDFSEAQQDSFIFGNVVSAFIYLTGDPESHCIAQLYSKGSG
jgi:hypothetical protein